MPNIYSDQSSSPFSDEQLIMAAQLYYEQGLSQMEVAKAVGVSQPQVSRMLGLARERGLVKITIADRSTRNKEAEQELLRVFNLKSAIVIGASSGLSSEQARNLTAHFGAPFVSAMVDQARCIAVAGGRMLSATSRHTAPAQRGEAPLFIQAMGNTGATANDWDAVEVGRRMSAQWNAQFLMLNTPAFFVNARACNNVQRLSQISMVLDHLNKADLAMLGIGTPGDSVFVEHHSLTDAEFARVRRAGAIGEICGRYFDAAGRECATTMKDRVIGISLELLTRIPNVLAIVAGENRAEALLGAIRGRLINNVILDHSAATALLDLHERTKQAKATLS